MRVTTGYPEDEVPALVLLAMKPYQLDAVAPRLAPILDEGTILVSILAGVELATLRARFPNPRVVIRAMPNLPVRIGKGMIGLHSDSGDVVAKALVTGLMATLGHAEWFEDEGQLELVTTLAGAGPAFLFRFIAALAEAAAGRGLPADLAQRVAIATAEGSAALARMENASLAELADRVTSKGGTTAAGLAVLDADGALRNLVERTFAASRRRSAEMAAAARESLT